MRRFSIFLVIVLWATTGLLAQQNYREKVKTCLQLALEDKDWQSELPHLSLKPSEVKAYQQMVWECWKEVLSSDFMPLSALDQKREGAIQLPDSLEPDATMQYYMGSKGTKPAGGYPFFIYMHGSGPSVMEWESGFRINTACKDDPSAVFIPKIPHEGKWYRWWQKGKQWVWERLFRFALASSDFDPNRLYMWGISEGGYGGQRLASFYADYLAGAGPVACGEPLINAPSENCANIAFSMTTGDKDMAWARNTFSTLTQERFAELEKAHPGLYKHNIILAPNQGHQVDYYSTTPWLRQFVRNPYPHYVCWEDYAMDGRRRDCFYNIVPVAPIKGDDRRNYEMTITGNQVDMKVSKVEYESLETDPRWNNITTRYGKTLSPESTGALQICLCDSLVNLQKAVVINVNGKRVSKGKVKCDLSHIVANCIRFYDPTRLYPAVVEVKW